VEDFAGGLFGGSVCFSLGRSPPEPPKIAAGRGEDGLVKNFKQILFLCIRNFVFSSQKKKTLFLLLLLVFFITLIIS